MQIFSKSCFGINVFKAMWHRFGELHLIQSSRGTHLMNIGHKRLPRARIKQEYCITLIQLEILKLASATQEVGKDKQGPLQGFAGLESQLSHLLRWL